MRKRNFWTAAAIVFILIAAACLGFSAWYFFKQSEAKKQYSEAAEEVRQETSASPSTEGAAGKETELHRLGEATLEEIVNAGFTGEIDAQTPDIPADVLLSAQEHAVDFVRLKSYNSELYAWIYVPGTNIDYPIAQHEGEEQRFYLYHDLYGNPQFAGCIFSEAPSDRSFQDPVTVLYGHNMKNGTMFQNLFRFLEESFFDEHSYLYVYTDKDTLVYEIYAIYPYDDRNIMTSFDFSKEEDLESYLEGTMNPRSMDAHVREGVRVKPGDQVLTLSTCIAGAVDQRLLLQAVLLHQEEEQTGNEITERKQSEKNG